MDTVWNVYVVVAVISFTFCLLAVGFLAAVGAFNDWMDHRRDRQVGRELKELSNEEATRRYLNNVFNKDQKED